MYEMNWSASDIVNIFVVFTGYHYIIINKVRESWSILLH